MRKNSIYYIIILSLLMLTIFISFSTILYINVKNDVRNNFYMETQDLLNNFIKLIDLNFSSVITENNHLENFKITENNPFSDIILSGDKLYLKSGEKFYLVPESLKNFVIKNFFSTEFSEKNFLIILHPDTLFDEIKNQLEYYYRLNSYYGFFETKHYLVSYKRHISSKDFSFTMVSIDTKDLVFKNIDNIFSLFLSIYIFIIFFIFIFIAFYINAFYNVIKIEEEAKKNLELFKINRTLILEKFSQSIVHNINNPLTSVLGYIQILMKKRPELVEQFKLNKVLENLLFVSDQMKILLSKKDESGKFNMDVNQFIKDELKFLEETLTEKNISFQFIEGKDLPSLKITVGDFKMIFENIVDNAIDAMEFSEIKNLIIRTYFQNRILSIEIEDSGEGISEEIKDKIFDLYFTTKNTEKFKNKGYGTGIGLYSVKKLVEYYNGKIKFISIAQKGTTFIISFPID